MRRAPLILVVVGLLAAGGCGGDSAPAEDPGAFVRSLVASLYRGDSATAWDQLHPTHQEAVTRERYVSCERKSPLEGDLKRFEVVRVRSESSPIPGGEETAPSTAVTFRVTLKLPGLPKAQPITHTAHVFAVGDRWAWVIGPSDFAVYAAGRCPGDI